MLTQDFLEKLHSDLSIPPTAKFNPESPTEASFEKPPTRPSSETSQTQPGSTTRKTSNSNSLRDASEETIKVEEARYESKRSSFPSTPAHSFLTSQGKKKNVEFHSLFPGLPLNEILIAGKLSRIAYFAAVI